MELIYLLVGLCIGAVASWLVAKSIFKKSDLPSPELIELDKINAIQLQQINDLKFQLQTLKQEQQSTLDENSFRNAEVAKWKANYDALDTRFKEERVALEALQQQMRENFANIANEIVVRNSQRIQDEQKVKLDDILAPFKEKIEKFESQVKVNHEERIREHQSMKEQLAMLQTMNKSIGDEARNLVSALKGQTKTQGNWGEMILEKVLERSGLMKGREYIVQASMSGDDGRRLQPDVVINLPESRNIIIDSKVSLIAYERYSSAETDDQRLVFLKEHIASIRKHIKDLSSKNYQNLYDINSLDFVLLFIPIEPAFSIAVENDAELFNEAFERNIVVVSTSTLLATLRTIASIWRLENQNKNSVEIARQAGDLYDKFSALLDDLITVGAKIKDTDKSYEAAMNKLVNGRGNLISRVENLKKLGVKTSKQINQKLIDRVQDLDAIDDADQINRVEG
jgi:DNA recombination protein RmuC